MTDPVQIAGGVAVNESEYIGPAREIRIDTTNWLIRIHDGVTLGGHIVPSMEYMDGKFQTRSTELDGIKFAPEVRGFATRRSEGVWVLRTHRVNELEFTLDNPDGFDGDPYLALQETIGTGHIWSQSQLFAATCEFSDGINADVFGTLTGNVTGNVTGNLTGNAAGNHTGKLTGNLDTRGKIVQMDDGTIDPDWIAGFAAAVVAAAHWPGKICAHFGTLASIPAGWALCNGANGTPDLRGKFVRGAATNDDVGDSGGTSAHNHVAATSTAGTHSHAGVTDEHVLTISEMPAHYHLAGPTDVGTAGYPYGTETLTTPTTESYNNDAADGNIVGKTNSVGGGLGHTHGMAIADSGGHAHGIEIDDANNLPPYVMLCYIMKLA